MKEFLKKELYSFRAVAAILARWLLLAVPTGLVCGAVGTAFHLAVEHVTEWRAEHIWLLWLLPVAGLAIVALYKVTGCEGVGTNNVIRAVHSGESVSPLLVPAIFFGTVLTHLCGGSAGREGAALQMGGSIGYNIAKLFRSSDHDRRTATACGMAAFFSALFGTPLAATLFGIMVEDVGLAFSVAFVPGFAAALIAYGVSLACGISPTHFELTAPALSIDSTLLVAVLGVACALVARAFCWLLHTMEHEMPRRLPNPWVRAVVGGVAVVALSYLMGEGRYNGADIYDDYAHHPRELHALLETVKTMGYRRVLCAFQPHTYTRTKALFHEFVEALKMCDQAVLAPIYAAREKNTIGIYSSDIAREVPGAVSFDSFDEIADYLRKEAGPNDLVLTMGAGNINEVGPMLIKNK